MLYTCASYYKPSTASPGELSGVCDVYDWSLLVVEEERTDIGVNVDILFVIEEGEEEREEGGEKEGEEEEGGEEKGGEEEGGEEEGGEEEGREEEGREEEGREEEGGEEEGGRVESCIDEEKGGSVVVWVRTEDWNGIEDWNGTEDWNGIEAV